MSHPVTSPFIEASQRSLLRRCAEEFRQRGDPPHVQVDLEFRGAYCLISNLQLALRHPGNNRGSAKVARQFIESIIAWMRQLGYVANAELAELGFDPAYDFEREAEPVKPGGAGGGLNSGKASSLLAFDAYAPMRADSDTLQAAPPETEAAPPPPGLSERDLVAQSECIRLMAYLADAGDMASPENLMLIMAMRLTQIADQGAGELIETPLIAPWVETARHIVARSEICPCDGPHCVGCGCCAHKPCEGGCTWATATLCSRCV